MRAVDGGLVLEVGLNSCNADVSVEVDEYADRVVIHPKRHDRHLWVTGSDDCSDQMRVSLEQPLGDRKAVNSWGREVAIETR